MASQIETDVIPTVQHWKVEVDTHADETAKDDFPEGGWQAWMTIAGGYVTFSNQQFTFTIVRKQVFGTVCNIRVRDRKFGLKAND